MTDAWGARVDYPAGIFTIDEGPPPRGMGRVLESADGDARFMVYVEENEAHHSPASFVASNLTMPASRIDCRRITDRFFAVSGENNARIFCSRCNFPNRQIGPMHCIFLSYRRVKESMGRRRYADQPVSASTVKCRDRLTGGANLLRPQRSAT
jgi:hypothetical protein